MSGLTEIIDCPVIIHPGFPKAGSTFLQTAFLCNVPKTLYIGSPLPRFPKKDSEEYKILNFFNNLKEFLFNIDEKIFNKVKNDKIKILKDNLKDIVNSIGINNINQIIYTDEGLTDISSETIVNRSKKANRMKLLFKNPYIFFVIRRQDHIIESLYGGYLKAGQNRNKNSLHPFCKFEKFLRNAYYLEINKYPKKNLKIKDEKYKRISVGFNRTLELPKYNKVISYYENTFGKGKIHVVLFENLISQPEMELAILPIKNELDYLKTENTYSTNPTVPTYYKYFHFKLRKFFIFDIIFKAINKFSIDNIIIKIFPILGRKIMLKWEEKIRNDILELYKLENIEISKKYNIDLKNKGYYL